MNGLVQSFCPGKWANRTVMLRTFGMALLGISLSVSAQQPEAVKPQPSATEKPTSDSSKKPASKNFKSESSSRPDDTLSVQQQLRGISSFPTADIDVAVRSKEMLAYLNAVLRFYRGQVSATQTVGEPSDVLYQEQASAQATQLAQLAFQFARNEAALLGTIKAKSGKPDTIPSDGQDASSGSSQQSDAQRIEVARENATAQIFALQAQRTALQKQIASSPAKLLTQLRSQDERLDGQIELQKAVLDTLSRIATSTSTQSNTGLLGDIDRLQRSSPELVDLKTKPVVPPVLENLNTARDSGVSSQAVVLFKLLSTRHAIDSRMDELAELKQQATELHAPLLKIIRSTIEQGRSLDASAAAANASAANASGASSSGTSDLAATRKRYDDLTTVFKVLSATTLPLSQELLVLEQSRSNLAAWRSAVDVEYTLILRSLLLHVAGIAIALGMLFLISYFWQRATVKYVRDLRRRRQFLLIRRIVVGFLGGCIVIFGFVTQFNSLATFAGFITAGIAVGLQTVLLSVAAYFFIVGRYGIRVGDRVTVAGVTGDVIEVGLVRFYLMELSGTGTELHPTGRVAVFANSVLFQSGIPLYKQMPGTEYAWHELSVVLKPGENFQPVVAAVTESVEQIYNTYKDRIDAQHRNVETWMDTGLQRPQVESRLQLAEGGLQFVVLFPVEIQHSSDIDSKITERLVDVLNTRENVRNAVVSTPVIKAALKG